MLYDLFSQMGMHFYAVFHNYQTSFFVSLLSTSAEIFKTLQKRIGDYSRPTSTITKKISYYCYFH